MSIEDTAIPQQYVVVSDTQPTNVFEGMLWVDTSGASPLTYVYTGGSFTLVTQDYSGDITTLQNNINTVSGTIGALKIADSTLGSPATTIPDVTVTADTYKDFVVSGKLIFTGATGGGTMGLILNDDSTAAHYIGNSNSFNSTTVACSDRSLTVVELSTTTNPASGDVMYFTAFIAQTASGRVFIKTDMILVNSSGAIRSTGSSRFTWTGTADVTKIGLLSGTNFNTGSTFTVWGLKK